MFARRSAVLLLLAGAILLSHEFPISLIAQDKARPGVKPGATATKKLPNSSSSGKVAVFIGTTCKNQALTANSPSKPPTPLNLPPTPKPMNAEEQIKLVQSDTTLDVWIRNQIETLRRQKLYSRLTPSQPKNEKGYLAFAGINTVLCSNSLDGKDSNPAEGLAYYSRQTAAASYPSIWIYHRAQKGNLYLFDISMETDPGDIPVKVAADGIVHPLPIAITNGHLLVIAQASGNEIDLAILIDTQASYNKLFFYTCEVTEFPKANTP